MPTIPRIDERHRIIIDSIPITEQSAATLTKTLRPQKYQHFIKMTDSHLDGFGHHFDAFRFLECSV
jgi:hypothetical protein